MINGKIEANFVKDNSAVVLGTSGTQYLNRNLGNKFSVTPVSMVTLATSNFAVGDEINVEIINGNGLITFPATWLWQGTDYSFSSYFSYDDWQTHINFTSTQGLPPFLEPTGVTTFNLRAVEYENGLKFLAIPTGNKREGNANDVLTSIYAKLEEGTPGGVEGFNVIGAGDIMHTDSQAFNGLYTPDGTYGGKTLYRLDATHILYFFDSWWMLGNATSENPGGSYYYATSSGSTPALSGWSSVLGADPAPTLTDNSIGIPEFVDSSHNSYSLTNTSVNLDSTKKYFGDASGLFTASPNSFIQVAHQADFDFGTGDFTVECFVNTTSNADFSALISAYGDGWGFYVMSDGTLGQYTYPAGSHKGTRVCNDGNFHHVALIRYKGTSNLYVDGISSYSWSDSVNYTNSGNLRIGYNDSVNGHFAGNIQEVKVSKGIARWTSNFIPPQPVDYDYTVLLDKFENNANDSSASNHTPTTTDVTYDIDKVFGNYSAVFNGSTSKITYPNSDDFYIGSGDYTVDFRLKLNTLGLDHCLYFQEANGNFSPLFIAVSTENKLAVGMSTSGTDWTVNPYLGGPSPYYGTTNLEADTWYHIAVVIRGGIMKAYINGVLEMTSAQFGILYKSINPLQIGFYTYTGGDISFLDGKLDEYRVSKGIARWTENFTAPIEEY